MDSEVPQNPVDPDRLNGWKEIASFLGKGVRTVQRWERELGLPVHRLGREGGEIVFAFRREIADWSLAQDAARRGEPAGDPAGPPPAKADEGATARAGAPARLRARVLGAAVFVVLAAALAAWTTWGPHGVVRQPASWRVSGDLLQVFDDDGASLWSHRFPVRLLPDLYSTSAFPLGDRVAIVDLDGDGNREILFGLVADAFRGPVQGFWVFDHDGSPRFDVRPDAVVHFGGTAYRAPWIFHTLFVTRGPDGSPSLWVVFTHAMEFPSLLMELDSTGTVRSEYWSNGFIEAVVETTWQGRPVVIVGATDNETRGASLAIFDRHRVTGSAPAVDPSYRCTDCPAGTPAEFLLFPRRCLSRAREGQPTVNEIWTDTGGRLHVSVFEFGPVQTTKLPTVWYWLGPDLTPERAELSEDLLAGHRELEKAGTLDHPFGPADEADLFPVRRWDGGHFVDLPPAPVTR